MAYGYYQEEVILAANVSADQTDFPVLLNRTLPGLRTIPNGGRVATLPGWDIVVSPNNDGSARYDHEVEFWDPVTGEWIVDFRLPALSSVVNNTFYVVYGDATVIADTQNIPGVWDADYKAVWHLNEGTHGQLIDSTVNNHDSNLNTLDSFAAGVVYRGMDDDGTERGTFPDSVDWIFGNNNPMAVEFWMRHRTLPADGLRMAYVGQLNLGLNQWVGNSLVNLGGVYRFFFDTWFVAPVNVASNPNIVINTWYHVAYTRDVLNDWHVLQDSVNIGGGIDATVLIDVASVLELGELNAGSNMDGQFDEVRITNGGYRDDDWIADSFFNQDDPTTFVGLVGGETPVPGPPPPPTPPGGEYLLGVPRRLKRKTRFTGRSL
jgi:hypothetical protein